MLLLITTPLIAAEGLPAIQAQNELKHAEQLAERLKPEQTVWLNAGQDKFLALFTPNLSGQPKGGAILLHDANGHPDWPDVIKPLRTSLPPHGWATLSIQLPQLSTLDGYIPYQELINSRIEKASEHMKSNGINNIIIIGHGSGGMAAAAYLANNPPQEMRGLVGIGLSVTPPKQDKNHLPLHLEKIKLPILDIYGSRDLNSVTRTAEQRSHAARQSSLNATDNNEHEPYKQAGLSTTSNNVQGYITYRQIVIEGANHNFARESATLTKRVLGWLDRHTNGTTPQPPR